MSGMSFGGFTGENSTQSGFFNMWEATAYSTNTYFLQREKDAGLYRDGGDGPSRRDPPSRR